MAAQKKKQNEINLVLKEEVGLSYYEQLLSWVLTYGRYIVIITQIIVLSVFFLRFKLDRDHADLKESVDQKQAIVESIGDLETEVRRIQGKLQNIRVAFEKQETVTNLLNYLEDHLPSDTTVSSLSISLEKISFTATSKNLNEFSFLLHELNKDKKFSEITLEDIKRRPDGRVEFKINAIVSLMKN